MFEYPYSTTALAAFAPKGLIPQLQAAIARRELPEVDEHASIREVPSTLKDIKPFHHPVVFESFGRHYVVVDTRAVVRYTSDGTRVVQNAADYNAIIARARLTYMWSVQVAVEPFKQLGDVPARTFTRILTEALSKRLGMSPAEYLKISVVSAYYYFGLFMSADELKNPDTLSMVNRIQRLTRIQPQAIMEILDGAAPPSNITEYSTLLQKTLGTLRGEKISPAFIYTILGGFWFGADARGVVAAALEFPPYFIGMCYTAAVDRSFNKTLLGKEVLTFNNRDQSLTHFVASVKSLMQDADYV